jgi:hypothetical protein
MLHGSDLLDEQASDRGLRLSLDPRKQPTVPGSKRAELGGLELLQAARWNSQTVGWGWRRGGGHRDRS